MFETFIKFLGLGKADAYESFGNEPLAQRAAALAFFVGIFAAVITGLDMIFDDVSFWTAVHKNLVFGIVAVGVFVFVNHLKAMRSARKDEPARDQD